MGAGNFIPTSSSIAKYDGYYIDTEFIYTENQSIIHDDPCYDDFKWLLLEVIQGNIASIFEVNEHCPQTGYYILGENKHIKIVLSHEDTYLAVYVIAMDPWISDYYNPCMTLGASKIKLYSSLILKSLKTICPHNVLRKRTGPWTSSTL